MADTSDTRNTVLGILAGAGCAALLISYATGNGSPSAEAGGRTCTTCRQPSAAINSLRNYVPTVTMTRE